MRTSLSMVLLAICVVALQCKADGNNVTNNFTPPANPTRVTEASPQSGSTSDSSSSSSSSSSFVASDSSRTAERISTNTETPEIKLQQPTIQQNGDQTTTKPDESATESTKISGTNPQATFTDVNPVVNKEDIDMSKGEATPFAPKVNQVTNNNTVPEIKIPHVSKDHSLQTSPTLTLPADPTPQQTLQTDNGLINNKVTGATPKSTRKTVDSSKNVQDNERNAAKEDKPSAKQPPVVSSANIPIKSLHNSTSSHSGENSKQSQQTEISTTKTVVPPETTETSENYTSPHATATSANTKTYSPKLSKAAQHLGHEDSCITIFSLFALATLATQVVAAMF